MFNYKMENKSVLTLKTRVSELEKQHNRLTTLVVSIMANCEKLKKRLLQAEGNISSDVTNSDIDNIINTSGNDSDDRTAQLLEELQKAQMTH
jgi:hypothetical protein